MLFALLGNISLCIVFTIYLFLHLSFSLSLSLAARGPEEVVERYKRVMKAFKKKGTLQRACDSVDVNRNTVVNTAVIAELYIACPDVYQAIIKQRGPSEKLSDLCARCREYIDGSYETGRKIDSSKESGRLLPIKK